MKRGWFKNVGVHFICAASTEVSSEVACYETAQNDGDLHHADTYIWQLPSHFLPPLSQINVASVELSTDSCFTSFHVGICSEGGKSGGGCPIELSCEEMITWYIDSPSWPRWWWSPGFFTELNAPIIWWELKTNLPCPSHFFLNIHLYR